MLEDEGTKLLTHSHSFGLTRASLPWGRCRICLDEGRGMLEQSRQKKARQNVALKSRIGSDQPCPPRLDARKVPPSTGSHYASSGKCCRAVHHDFIHFWQLYTHFLRFFIVKSVQTTLLTGRRDSSAMRTMPASPMQDYIQDQNSAWFLAPSIATKTLFCMHGDPMSAYFIHRSLHKTLSS